MLNKFPIQQLLFENRELISGEIDRCVYRIICRSQDPLHYKVGDALGVFPKNDPDAVAVILNKFKKPSSFLVQTHRMQKPMSLGDFLSSSADLVRIPKKLFPSCLAESTVPLQKTLLDLLEELPSTLSIENFVNELFPLLPRFYSIASAPELSAQEVELLVRQVGGNGETPGVCSSFLCERLQPQETFAAYIHPTKNFTISPAMFGKPIVMIGMGTGIAPYKAFLQKRLHDQDPGDNYLFFGERHQDKHFYYRDFWKAAENNSQLHLFLAFSRDQASKIYVQDLLKQQHNQIQQLASQDAVFFVCGKKILNKEIRSVLEEILGKDGFDVLRKNNRYIVDVY